MVNPRIDIDYNKLKHNAIRMVMKYKEHGIDIAAVTKGFCAIPEVAEAIFEGGVKYFADSRIENLIKLKDFPLEKILLRLPMISQTEAVVNYADITLNSEIETIKALNQWALKVGKIHKIILMIDLGDLREGIFDDKELYIVCRELKTLKNIKVLGVGTNLTCYGGVIPSEENLGKLVEYAKRIEKALDTQLEIISGGNSSSVFLVEEGKIVEGINNLRLGEVILLGVETSYGEIIPENYQDIITLVAEIIEVKEKPSLPIGEIGRDAFGNVPTFADKGMRKRAILAIGKQDFGTHEIIPVDKSIEILGSSSDHLIIDITDCQQDLKVGDEVKFNVTYGSMLALTTSQYVHKNIVK